MKTMKSCATVNSVSGVKLTTQANTTMKGKVISAQDVTEQAVLSAKSRTIHWVEDDEGIREVLSELLEAPVVFHESHATCEPEEGDIVIHDLNGVGELIKRPGVKYQPASGSSSGPFAKPFDFKAINKYLASVRLDSCGESLLCQDYNCLGCSNCEDTESLSDPS